MTNIEQDISTLELLQARPRIRNGLRFTLHSNRRSSSLGERSTHSHWLAIENTLTGQFYRTGAAEYAFLSLMDGKKTIECAIAETCDWLGPDAFTDRDAIQICQWAIESGILDTPASRHFDRVRKRGESAIEVKKRERRNPISFRIPLFNPDPLVERVHSISAWLFSSLGLFIAVAVLLLGSCILVTHIPDLFSERLSAVSANDFLWMGATWIVLKGFHELAHAVVCKHYGGKVPLLGLNFLLLVPMPYVDLSAAWQFTNKWHRIQTSLAGIATELLIASIAAMVWLHSDPGPLRYHLENIILTASVGTLLFNSNPLMRFDGYYVLADWLEVPNLYQKGRTAFSQLLRTLFMGLDFPTSGTAGKSIALGAYGFMCVGWSWLVSISMLFAVFSIWEGVGLILALFALTVWYGVPFARNASNVWLTLSNHRRARWQFGVTSSSIAAASLGALVWLPAPTRITAPAVVDHHRKTPVFAEAYGFIKSLHVQSGGKVLAGQLIATMESPELVNQVVSIESAIEVAKLKLQSLLSESNVVESQQVQEELDALEKRYQEFLTLRDALQVRSPTSGTILTPGLEEWVGRYIPIGKRIAEIGDERGPQIIALIDQRDRRWLEIQAETDAKFVMDGGLTQSWPCQVTAIQPRAQDYLPHPAFSASYGGRLSVVDRHNAETNASQIGPKFETAGKGMEGELIDDSAQALSSMRLTSSRILVELNYISPPGAPLQAGMTGAVYFGARAQSLGSYLFGLGYHFATDRITRSHGL